jgi:hypothetical protein
MMRLRNKRYDVPGGWLYVTDDQVVISEKVFDLLIDAAIRHFKANGRFADAPGLTPQGKIIYTRQTLTEEVEQYICKHAPIGWCSGDDRVEPPERLTTERIIAVSRGLLANLTNKVVPLETANTRAAICVSCVYNSTVTAGCWSCNAARSVIARLVKLQTSFDKQLLVCTKCGCVLRAKIHLTDETIRKINTEPIDKYPNHCWVYQILKA